MTKRVLLQSSWILEPLSTSLTHALLQVRVRNGVSAQVALGEERCWTERAGKPLFMTLVAWVLELLVQSQIVLLSAGKSTVLTHIGLLSTVGSIVNQQPGFLTENFSTGRAREALDVCQVLVFVSQLVRSKRFITKLALENFLAFRGMLEQLVVFTSSKRLETPI